MSNDNVFNMIVDDNIHEHKLIATVMLNLRLISIEEARLQDPSRFDNMPSLFHIEKIINESQDNANIDIYTYISNKY